MLQKDKLYSGSIAMFAVAVAEMLIHGGSTSLSDSLFSGGLALWFIGISVEGSL